MNIKIVNKSKHPFPSYETIHSAGMDLRANINDPIKMESLGRAMIPTDLFIELPEGYEAQVRPRSGLAAREGVTVLNTPGTIDADYRGEIKIIMVNLSKNEFVVNDGDRIAQMIINKHERAEWLEVQSLKDSERGAGGFASTGTK
ncbi:MAG: dUTP diphosphatase [Bacteroidales bacterium]|nr:dUTP diphosphatase [Bacteroidales bacterium]